jgi:hypothetical protein
MRGRGFVLPKLKFRGLPTCGLQLSVLVEHRAAIARDAPAMGGERCTTTRKVAPRHAGGAIAHSRGGRLARRKLGEIDRVGSGGGKADQNAGGYYRLHAGVHPSCCWKRRAYSVTAGKSSIFVRRTTSHKSLKVLEEISITPEQAEVVSPHCHIWRHGQWLKLPFVNWFRPIVAAAEPTNSGTPRGTPPPAARRWRSRPDWPPAPCGA